MSPNFRQTAASANPASIALTPEQREVWERRAEGMSYREIAVELKISVDAVRGCAEQQGNRGSVGGSKTESRARPATPARYS